MTEIRHELLGAGLGPAPLPTSLFRVRRFLGRTIAVFGIYTAALLAVVIAGFIGQAVGIWAAVLWGVVVIAGVVVYGQRRWTT